MAKKPTSNTSSASKHKVKAKKTRKGIHSKTKHSYSKNAKSYSKRYRGQGKRR
jgi:hypothetical protein